MRGVGWLVMFIGFQLMATILTLLVSDRIDLSDKINARGWLVGHVYWLPVDGHHTHPLGK